MLEDLNEGWEVKDQKLNKVFSFKGYYKTIAFVNSVAWLAQKQNHHPDLLVKCNSCEVSLTTHDANNTLTAKDYALAKAIDAL